MTYEDIVVEKFGEALEITLNRPEKLNAIREQTAAEIMHAMDEVEMDRAIVAVILQGSEKGVLHRHRHQRVSIFARQPLRRLSAHASARARPE